MLEERHHFSHIGPFGLRAGAVVRFAALPPAHAAAEHDPERARNLVRAELASMATVESKLLIKYQQSAHEQLLRTLLRPGGEIQHLEILPVAIAVKIAVAVIEQNRLAVVAHQQLALHTACRSYSLGEGRAVFHEKSGCAQCLLTVLPGLRVAAYAFMAFIHEHEIAPTQFRQCDAHPVAARLVGQFVDFHHHYLRAKQTVPASRTAFLDEPAALHAALAQLAQVLLGQTLVGCDEKNVIPLSAAVGAIRQHFGMGAVGVGSG